MTERPGAEEAVTAAISSRNDALPETVAESRPVLLAQRYELLSLLGSGGMGTVYRARDTVLDEVVALKVLQHELARSPDALERFRREVKLARKVTHRNVARVFDIGEDGAERFLTMELVDGMALSVIARQGPMSPADVVAIALQVCDGLSASHEAGVLHGDLKPANVMHTSAGRIVITDFGIARALTSAADDPLAEDGVVTGTPGYMAPEQVEGAADLDARADLYALGCMLFRLVTGTMPWSAATSIGVAAARLLKPPPDPRSLAPVPSALADVILRCMARRREDRFATAAAVAEALGGASATRSWAPLAAPRVTKASVAVLPLSNDGDPRDLYLADGLTAEIVDRLSASAELRVLAHRPGATRQRDPRSAGAALGVDAVVHGEVRRHDDVVRATIRVLSVRDGFQLGAFELARPAIAILELASEGANAVARVLSSAEVVARDAPTNAEAIDLYLRGRSLYTRYFYEHTQASELLRRAHTLAPTDGRIGAALALSLVRRQHMTHDGTRLGDEARELARAAIAQDPRNADAHAALAYVHCDEAEYRSGAIAIRSALELDPGQSDALEWKGRLLLETGETARAVRLLQEARALYGDRDIYDILLARAYFDLGEWDAADAVLAIPSSDIRLRFRLRARFAGWARDRVRGAALAAEIERHEQRDDPSFKGIRALVHAVVRGHWAPEDVPEFLASVAQGQSARAAAFRAQVEVEVRMIGNDLDRARAILDELDEHAFLDLAWLDRCPLLDELRSTPELQRLRRATAARAARVLRALDDVEATVSSAS